MMRMLFGPRRGASLPDRSRRWPSLDGDGGSGAGTTAMTNGQQVCIDVVSRSARPRTLPSRVSASSQPSRATKMAVTAAEPRTLRISGRGEARRAAKAGHTAIVTAPRTVQARCRGVAPLAGSGDAAMPMPAIPATISRARADARTPVHCRAGAHRPGRRDRQPAAWPVGDTHRGRSGSGRFRLSLGVGPRLVLRSVIPRVLPVAMR